MGSRLVSDCVKLYVFSINNHCVVAESCVAGTKCPACVKGQFLPSPKFCIYLSAYMGVDEGPIFSWAALTWREGLINLYPVVLLRNRVWREVSVRHVWRDRFFLPASFVYCTVALA